MMNSLLVLWDPRNPLVPVASVVEALQADPKLDIRTLTFDDVGHPTLPNFAVDAPLDADGLLWIEGGPLPRNLEGFTGPKACWLLNTHLEPTLIEDIAPMFDVVFSARLRDTADEQARWLPPSACAGSMLPLPAGVSLLHDDPQPPAHVEAEDSLVAAAAELHSDASIVVAMGNGDRAHPLLFDALRSGAVVVADPDTDLRGIASPGDHAVVASGDLATFVRDLLQDPEKMTRMSNRARAIADHLHQPGMRAARIREGLWPSRRVLSGHDHCPRVSVLVTCYRYLQRFRICLESLARQEMEPGSLEIVVADPGSPDGLAAHLEVFASNRPGLRVVHLPLDSRYHRNRGVGINRAFDESRGRVVIGIDGDLVFPPSLIGFLEAQILRAPNRIFGVKRTFINRPDTEAILRGELDPFSEFERLSLSEGDGEPNNFVGVLGYCQAVHRKAFARARYPEELDMVNQSDIVFVERLEREAGVAPRFLDEQTVLHLWHPRNWQGTTENL